MMRGKVWALVAGACIVGACGDDDPNRPDDPDLTRADVAGQYEMTELSFDPQGSLPEMDLLARLDNSDLPDLRLYSTQDSVQLVFIDPEDDVALRIVPGTYELGDEDVTIELQSSLDASRLLLPAALRYGFDASSETLSFTGTIQADTTRLFALVPEWSGEPVTNPLPGILSVRFARQ